MYILFLTNLFETYAQENADFDPSWYAAASSVQSRQVKAAKSDRKKAMKVGSMTFLTFVLHVNHPMLM